MKTAPTRTTLDQMTGPSQITLDGEAKAQYEQRSKYIKTLIRELDKTIDYHAEEFRRAGQNDYGYVGDLGHVTKSLNELIQFLNGNM